MLKKANFFSDNQDLLWHFNNSFDFAAAWQMLAPPVREASGATSPEEYKALWMEVLSSFGEVCGSAIAPNAKRVEDDGISLDASGKVVVPETLRKNIETLIQLGAPGVGSSVEFGGTSAPAFIELAAMEILYRACPSTALNCSWWGPIAHVIEKFGGEREKQMAVPKLASGEWSGAMALTEPDAGSDLAHLSTWAEQDAEGTWRLTGTKRFISNGNSEVILVLAKNAKGAVGLEHLSLFMCLRDVDGRCNVQVTKIEHKLGLKASATCELKFDGAKAYLLGEDGKGFSAMLKLMNEMRIGVAMQGVGLMEATLRMAQEYASQRKAWGKPIAHHELIAEKLLDMEVELKAARSLTLRAANEQGMVRLIEQYLQDNPGLPPHERSGLEAKLDQRRRRVRNWTPLIKYWVAENAFLHARTCMQIFGGYGFTTEYRAEWWLREAMILPVYEGTSQIQALMCLKDTLKQSIRKPGVLLEKALGNQMLAFSAGGGPAARRLAKCRQLYYGAVLTTIRKVVAEAYRAGVREAAQKAGHAADDKAHAMDLIRSIKLLSGELRKQENFRPALLNAERICEMKSLVEMAESLRRDARKDPARKWVFERFVARSLPRMVALKALVDADDPVLSARLAASDRQVSSPAEVAVARDSRSSVDAATAVNGIS
jgi:alkylation response protein AidB-like acyl-CoA dehydrogenase